MFGWKRRWIDAATLTILALIILTLVHLYDQPAGLMPIVEVSQDIRKVDRHLGGRYDEILRFCGQLCDLSKPIEPGPIVGTVTAKVDCPAIFASEEIDRPSDTPPVPWENVPVQIQKEFTYDGSVEVKPWFINGHYDSSDDDYTIFSEKVLQKHIDDFLSGKQKDWYQDGSNLINKAADVAGVEGKTVLVIGTQDPWVEAILFTKKPKLVMTLEYGRFVSEYPKHEFVTPKVFRDRYRAGELPVFDLIVTYSSVEHSGLGRYGDALNPWGDILSVARAWCVSAINAKLMIGVPTGGKDLIQFNAHKVYGPIMYPYLVTNWKFNWSSSGSYVPEATDAKWSHQPVYIFHKLHPT